MDYKAKIIELVEKIRDVKLLRFIYYMLDDAYNRHEELFGESTGE